MFDQCCELLQTSDGHYGTALSHNTNDFGQFGHFCRLFLRIVAFVGALFTWQPTVGHSCNLLLNMSEFCGDN